MKTTQSFFFFFFPPEAACEHSSGIIMARSKFVPSRVLY